MEFPWFLAFPKIVFYQKKLGYRCRDFSPPWTLETMYYMHKSGLTFLSVAEGSAISS